MIRLRYFFILFLFLLPITGIGQITCIYLNSISDFQPDQLCSPVEVTVWNVTYTGVQNDGKTVQVHYDWGDGHEEIKGTTESPAGTFKATADHTYYDNNDVCKYNARATMVIGGDKCENSTVETSVPVWNVDNENGAYVYASPWLYPVCIGEGASMRFDDDTRYNCVPPQEDDIRNESTRWIQWVYGTNVGDANFMSVRVNGSERSWPYTPDPPKTLPGPSWGSSERSLPIIVADDKMIGQEFEVELRYWNYCNKYPDGKPPVIDRSVIRIVGLPDPTIDPVDTLCEFSPSVFLTAATGGGTWFGNGIINSSTGEFAPYVSGSGTHEIRYTVTDGNSCSNSDTTYIVVRDTPDGEITPVDPFCIYDSPYDLEAASSLGTWSGTGITNTSTGLFDPADAGLGRHQIVFNTTPDAYGCFGTDTAEMAVVDVPAAEFLTPDSAWCIRANNQANAQILITGTDSSKFDLVLEMRGDRDTLFNLSNDTFTLFLNNQPGLNEYLLHKIIEHHGSNSCETELADTLAMEVYPLPDMTVTASFDDPCTPVEVEFNAVAGLDRYYWNFGDNDSTETRNEITSHTYSINPDDQHRFYVDTVDGIIDTIHYEVFIMDTTFNYQLIAQTSRGCRDTISDELRIYNKPIADFFVSPEIQNYPETDIFLINRSSYGTWSYLWDFGDTHIDTVKEPTTYEYDTYGFYDIELKTYNEFCRDSITKRIQIMPPPPIAEFEPDSIGCPPLSITFSNTSLYADSYVWDFDAGQFSAEENPTQVFFQNKEHDVTLAARGLSGTDTVHRTITIYDPPQALFTVYPPEAKSLNQVFTFTNSSIGAVNYLWEFGDGDISSDAGQTTTHVYREEGTYSVTLYAWSEHECADTLIKDDLITVVAGEGEVNFPNAFVWTGAQQTDGAWDEENITNNVFHPHVINVVKFRMEIYTRWGELIWETDEIYKGWDGYLKTGELAAPGVYVYKAWWTTISGDKDWGVGDVTFLH